MEFEQIRGRPERESAPGSPLRVIVVIILPNGWKAAIDLASDELEGLFDHRVRREGGVSKEDLLRRGEQVPEYRRHEVEHRRDGQEGLE